MDGRPPRKKPAEATVTGILNIAVRKSDYSTSSSLQRRDARATEPELDPIVEDDRFYVDEVEANNKKSKVVIPLRFSAPEIIYNHERGQGEILLAEDQKQLRRIALKRPRLPDPSKTRDEKRDIATYKSVIRELKIMRAVSHPNIIELFGAFTPQIGPDNFRDLYYVMPQMHGTLKDYIDEKRALSEKPQHSDIQSLAIQLLRGTRFLHSKDIWHRDLKPGNIGYIKERNGFVHVYILDYGHSRHVSRELKKKRDAMTDDKGTRVYNPLEVIYSLAQGSYTEKRDTWSIGAVIGELVLLKALFYDESGAHTVTAQTIAERIFKLLGPPADPEEFRSRFETQSASGILAALLILNGRETGTFNSDFNDNTFSTLNEKTPLFRDFLLNLLNLRSEERLSADEALQHPYLQDVTSVPGEVPGTYREDELPEQFEQMNLGINATKKTLRELLHSTAKKIMDETHICDL